MRPGIRRLTAQQRIDALTRAGVAATGARRVPAGRRPRGPRGARARARHWTWSMTPLSGMSLLQFLLAAAVMMWLSP
ncbi:hypothetical protein, partial [Nocardia cyriacigeorgica]|uniref:hypothetical protein n=1 Tax=Nocardia cyriacigeorgica TaxID=135487 RepID=UPI002454E9B1